MTLAPGWTDGIQLVPGLPTQQSAVRPCCCQAALMLKQTPACAGRVCSAGSHSGSSQQSSSGQQAPIPATVQRRDLMSLALAPPSRGTSTVIPKTLNPEQVLRPARARALGAADVLQVVPVQLQLLLHLEVELASRGAPIPPCRWLQQRQPLLVPQIFEVRDLAWFGLSIVLHSALAPVQAWL